MESRLSLLGIKGPVNHLRPLTKITEVVTRAITRGAKTLIVVGDDRTLLKLINCMPNRKKIACGLVCLGPMNKLAETLYLDGEQVGVEAIAARKLLCVNLGKVNKTFFLQRIDLSTSKFTAIIDDKLIIKTTSPQSHISILNPSLAYNSRGDVDYLDCHITPIKNRLLAVKSIKSGTSRIPIKKLTIKSQEPITIRVDQEKKPNVYSLTAGIAPQAINLIVGRKRIG